MGCQREKRRSWARQEAGKVVYWAGKLGLLQNSRLLLFSGLPDNLHGTQPEKEAVLGPTWSQWEREGRVWKGEG